MKKPLKIFLILLGVILVGIGLVFANAIYGNPFSKAMAKGAANKYIAQTYRDTDFALYDIHYNFKDGYYHAEVISPTSRDTYFDLAIAGKKIVYDSYEDVVLSGWNTWQRLDQAYRELTDKVLESEEFPFKSEIAFGEIALKEDYLNDPTALDYGISLDELELDGDYDINQLATTTGKITFYAENEEVTFEKARELLLRIKDEFDQADVPFYAIDFVLEKPRMEDGTRKDDVSIHTTNFLYENIYEDGLSERIEQNHQLLMEYYEEQDKLLEKDRD